VPTLVWLRRKKDIFGHLAVRGRIPFCAPVWFGGAGGPWKSQRLPEKNLGDDPSQAGFCPELGRGEGGKRFGPLKAKFFGRKRREITPPQEEEEKGESRFLQKKVGPEKRPKTSASTPTTCTAPPND